MSGRGTTSSTETPSTVTPTARRVARSTIVTIVLRPANASITPAGRGRRNHDGEIEAGVRPPARIAGSRAAQPAGDLSHEVTRLVEQQPAPCPWGPAPQALQDAGFRLRADPGHRLEPTAEGRRSEVVGRPHVERAPDLDHSLRADAEQPPEADQLRLHLALELVELRDRARLDQLAEACGDARPDPAELLHPSRAHELADRRPRLADRLGSAAVGARRVAARAGQLEQGCERLQSLGDLSVVRRPRRHVETMPGPACAYLRR